MASINYKHFHRVLARSAEVAAEPGAPEAVKNVFAGVLAAPLATYRAAHEATTDEESKHALESKQARAALDALDQAFRVTRGVVLAFVPTMVVPETLRSQTTDTDQLLAIEALLDVLDDHASEPWAATELAGAFGVQAPIATKELSEAIASSKTLSAARTARAAAYGPAWEAYLAYKRVVRDAFGPQSRQYRRIHLRANGRLAEDSEPPPAPPEPAPPAPAPPAPPAG